MQAKLGRKMNMRSQAALVKAMCAATRCASLGCMGLVTRSFSPAGLGARKGSIELSRGPEHAVPGIEWVLVAGPPLPERVPFSHRGPCCDKKRRGVVVNEGEWRALLSW